MDSDLGSGGVALEKPKQRLLLDENRQVVLNWVRDQRKNLHRLISPFMVQQLPHIDGVREDGQSFGSAGRMYLLESIPAFTSACSSPPSAGPALEDTYPPLIVTSPPFQTHVRAREPVVHSSTESSNTLRPTDPKDNPVQTASPSPTALRKHRAASAPPAPVHHDPHITSTMAQDMHNLRMQLLNRGIYQPIGSASPPNELPTLPVCGRKLKNPKLWAVPLAPPNTEKMCCTETAADLLQSVNDKMASTNVRLYFAHELPSKPACRWCREIQMACTGTYGPLVESCLESGSGCGHEREGLNQP